MIRTAGRDFMSFSSAMFAQYRMYEFTLRGFQNWVMPGRQTYGNHPRC
jgi:hypothetical protein